MANVSKKPQYNRIEYLVGDKIGKSTYLKEIGLNNSRQRIALFRCHCGNEFSGVIKDVKRRNMDCGCQRSAHNRIRYEKGDKLRWATYLEDRPTIGKISWALFLCHCGREFESPIGNIRRGVVKGCGCGRKTHGLAKTDEWNIWSKMRHRCSETFYNTKIRKYYSDRGIKVCERWLNSFENFFEDMGKRPSKKHSIDRIDNDKGYSPENCRWATLSEQSNNRRNVPKYEMDGEVHSMTEWARIKDVSVHLLRSRVTLYKWDFKKAVETPARNLSPKGHG